MTLVLVRGRQVNPYESHDAVDGMWLKACCLLLYSAFFRAPFGVWTRDALQRVQRTHARGFDTDCSD